MKSVFIILGNGFTIDFINNTMLFQKIKKRRDPNQKAKRLSMINSEDDRIYLRAYCELIVYLRQLFSWYDSLIDDVLLKEFVSTCSDWGWLSFLQNLNLKEFKKIFLYHIIMMFGWKEY